MANKVKSSLPKYIAIFDSIVERIKSGNLKVGDRVPSENELIADFNISNTTARKVLQELQNKAWVRRIKGSGTFVMKAHSEKIERELASFEAICGNFSDNLTRDGFAPKENNQGWYRNRYRQKNLLNILKCPSYKMSALCWQRTLERRKQIYLT